MASTAPRAMNAADVGQEVEVAIPGNQRTVLAPHRQAVQAGIGDRPSVASTTRLPARHAVSRSRRAEPSGTAAHGCRRSMCLRRTARQASPLGKRLAISPIASPCLLAAAAVDENRALQFRERCRKAASSRLRAWRRKTTGAIEPSTTISTQDDVIGDEQQRAARATGVADARERGCANSAQSSAIVIRCDETPADGRLSLSSSHCSSRSGSA